MILILSGYDGYYYSNMALYDLEDNELENLEESHFFYKLLKEVYYASNNFVEKVFCSVDYIDYIIVCEDGNIKVYKDYYKV